MDSPSQACPQYDTLKSRLLRKFDAIVQWLWSLNYHAELAVFFAFRLENDHDQGCIRKRMGPPSLSVAGFDGLARACGRLHTSQCLSSPGPPSTGLFWLITTLTKKALLRKSKKGRPPLQVRTIVQSDSNRLIRSRVHSVVSHRPTTQLSYRAKDAFVVQYLQSFSGRACLCIVSACVSHMYAPCVLGR